MENPYHEIVNWAESRVKLVGKKVFQFAALQPVSLIMPDFPYEDGTIKSNINFLLLAPSGSGKTTCAQMFSEITYQPFDFNSITSARFEEEMYGKKEVSLICGELATIARDPILIKTMEGVLGEEKKLSRFTMQKTRSSSVNAVFFGAGIPNQITKYLKFGFVQRTVPLVLFHTPEEKVTISKWINDSMFRARSEHISLDQIHQYYQRLWDIQKNKNNDFPPITGFVVDKKIRDAMFAHWQYLNDSLLFPNDTYLIRENHSGYRYICASAMLELFSRKIENNEIVVTQHDLERAKNLLTIEMQMKCNILNLDKIMREQNDVVRLYKSVVENEELDYSVRKLGELMMKERGKIR